MSNKLVILVVSGILSVTLILGSMFSVKEWEMAIVFQFGEAVRTIKDPGLNFKIPFIQKVQIIDNRILNIEVEEKELTASDEKRLIIDSFAKYRIIDSIKFVKTVHNYGAAELRLRKILESKMRAVIGGHPLSTLLTDKRSDLILEIRDLMHSEAEKIGIEIIDVRIIKADLPRENSQAIYSRMQTERQKEAKQIRAEGGEEAAVIMSTADKERKIILADAYNEAQIIKGRGEAKAAEIYNRTYSRDPEFYKFYRSLIAYKNTIEKENTEFIVSPDSEFLKYLYLGKK